MKTKHILVTGTVQGVGYRQFTMAQANKFGIVGWVKNLADGRVEVQATGNDAKMSAFLAELRKGPPFSRVEDLQISDLTETVASDEFVILR